MKLFRRLTQSLFARILSIAALCIVLSMVISILSIGYMTTRSYEHMNTESLTRVANEKASELQTTIATQQAVANSIAKEIFNVDYFQKLSATGTADSNDFDRIQGGLNEKLNESGGLYENIFFTYLDSGNSLVGDFQISPVTGLPAIPIAAPVKDPSTGQVLSVFALPINLNVLLSGVTSKENEQVMTTVVTDEKGMVIASHDAEQILKTDFTQLDNEGGLKQIASAESGAGDVTIDGVRYLASFVRFAQHPSSWS